MASMTRFFSSWVSPPGKLNSLTAACRRVVEPYVSRASQTGAKLPLPRRRVRANGPRRRCSAGCAVRRAMQLSDSVAAGEPAPEPGADAERCERYDPRATVHLDVGVMVPQAAR